MWRADAYLRSDNAPKYQRAYQRVCACTRNHATSCTVTTTGVFPANGIVPDAQCKIVAPDARARRGSNT